MNSTNGLRGCDDARAPERKPKEVQGHLRALVQLARAVRETLPDEADDPGSSGSSGSKGWRGK